MVSITTGEGDTGGQATVEAAGRVSSDRAARADRHRSALAGRYRLAEVVGRGATARVWRARDELLDRDVAVKQVDHAHGRVEARLAARVRHPHVTVVHDVVVHDGSDWLVMDYHQGASLATVLSRGRRRLPPTAVGALGLQLLAALRAVHAAGVVHCDVKPANVMLGEDGRPVLVDFGIAETAGGDPPIPPAAPATSSGPGGRVVGLDRRGRPVARRPSRRPDAAGSPRAAPKVPRVRLPTLTAVLHDAPQPARRAGRLRRSWRCSWTRTPPAGRPTTPCRPCSPTPTGAPAHPRLHVCGGTAGRHGPPPLPDLPAVRRRRCRARASQWVRRPDLVSPHPAEGTFVSRSALQLDDL